MILDKLNCQMLAAVLCNEVDVCHEDAFWTDHQMQLHVVFDRHLRKKSEICHREFVCLDFHRRTALDKCGNVLVIYFHRDVFLKYRLQR